MKVIQFFMLKQFEDYKEEEFLELLNRIVRADTPSEKELDELVDHFEEVTEHPGGSDLIYYPDKPENGEPEKIIDIVKKWRLENRLPCFK